MKLLKFLYVCRRFAGDKILEASLPQVGKLVSIHQVEKLSYHPFSNRHLIKCTFYMNKL
jgi:hypothetical protein